MAIIGVTNIEFDGTCGVLTVGAKEIPILKLDGVGIEVKPEMGRNIGEQGTTYMTPGIAEPTQATLTLRSSVFADETNGFLSLFADVGVTGAANKIFDSVTYTEASPSIGGTKKTMSVVRFVGVSSAYENSSKANEVQVKMTYLSVAYGDKGLTWERQGSIAAQV